MQEVYRKAEELAEEILQSKQYKQLLESESLAEGNAEVQDLIKQYNDRATKIAEKEKNTQPIEPDEKRQLQTLMGQMQSNQLLQNLLKAQADYAQLMNKINEILSNKLERKR